MKDKTSSLKQFLNQAMDISFLKNVQSVVLSKLLCTTIKFLLRILVLRLLTKNDFGIISTLSATVVYFDLIADFSTHPIMSREMVTFRDKRPHVFFNYFTIKMMMGVIACVLFILTSFLLGYDKYPNIIAFITLNIFFNSLANSFDIIWQTNNQFKKLALINIISITLGTLLSAAIIYQSQTYPSFFIAALSASLITLFVKFKGMTSELNIKTYFASLDTQLIKKTLIESAPLTLGSFFYLLCYRVDVIVLEKLGKLSDVADYNASFSVLEQIIEVIWAQFLIVFYPKMIETHAKSPRHLMKICRNLSLVLIPVFLAGFALSYFVSPKVFNVVFGAKYTYSGMIFTYLLPAQLCFILFSIYYRVTIIFKKSSLIPLWCFFAACLNLVSNINLIPTYGVMGAVFTTFITSTFLAIATFIYAHSSAKKLLLSESVK